MPALRRPGGLGRAGCPTCQGKVAPEVPKRSWFKVATEVAGSANIQKVLLVNGALGGEIVLLVPDLLCKCKQWVLDIGVEKGREKGRD